MSSRNALAPALIACLLTIGAAASEAEAVSTGRSMSNFEVGAQTLLIKAKHRRRAARLYVPIAPNYLAYDYPYYFKRGYYPKHIGPGYMYYGYPYSYYRKVYYRGADSRCSKRRRSCRAYGF